MEPQLDRTLLALADPKRRAILRRLAQGEARVTELAAPFNVSLNAVSKHIKLLEQAGLVRRRRRGREHFLRFEPEPLAHVQDWIGHQTACWQATLWAMDDLLGQEDSSAAGDRDE